MFNIDQYPEILIHLQQISGRFNKLSSGWIEIFCPYCDDAVRKYNPSHGHFHLSSSYPYGHCFRCGVQVGLDKILSDTKFSNLDIIAKLKQTSGFTYQQTGKAKSNKRFTKSEMIQNSLNHYQNFGQQYPQYMSNFKEYVYKRCCEINPIGFGILPILHESGLALQFYNYDGNLVTTRLLFHYKMRYLIPNIKHLYYFQDIDKIDEYQDIVITEGALDLINLYSYCSSFTDDMFYLSIGGNQYRSYIKDLINTHLLIGKYNIHVVLDQGLKRLDSLIKSTKQAVNELNPECLIKFYLPIVSKDVSECMLIKKIA